MTTKSWVIDAQKNIAGKVAMDMTERFHQENPTYINKEARYETGDSKTGDPSMFGIYFIDREYEPPTIGKDQEATVKKNFKSKVKAFLKSAFWPFKNDDQSITSKVKPDV